MQTDLKLLDNRTIHHNLAQGKITQKEYDAFMSSLEDCAELSEESETEFIHKVPDEEEED